MKFTRKVISSLIALLVAFSTNVFNTQNVQASTQQLEIHHINVGQGDSTYIELPDGTDILIDAGKSGSGSTVVNYLNNQESGMDIEYLISTHPDADHSGGMKSIFTDMKVKNFYYPKDAPSDTKTWQTVLDLASKEGCNIIDAKSNTSLSIAGVTIKLIQPNKDYSSDNDDSLVTYLDYKDAEYLLTGDIEENVEKEMVAQGLVPNVDFMSVPHHGSNTSSTSDFIKVADPEYAIISVGKNSYGHPSADVINRYTSIGSEIWRTDTIGDVVVKTDGVNASINGKSVLISEEPSNDWETNWAKTEIKYAMDSKWVETTTKFRPEEAITRAEFIKIVNKAFGFTTGVSSETFEDVNKSDWWYNEVLIALKNGYITNKNTTFRPRDPITREEVASIVTSIKNNKDTNLDKIKTYKDFNKVSPWAQSSVEGAIEAKYMGLNSDMFNPKQNITRAQSVVTLYRIVTPK